MYRQAACHRIICPVNSVACIRFLYFALLSGLLRIIFGTIDSLDFSHKAWEEVDIRDCLE